MEKKSLKSYWKSIISGGQGRQASLDALRILGILMVLYNHSGLYTAFLLRENCDLMYWLQILFSIVSKCGAPLFFMVSGALLLRKDEKYSYTLIHRVLRMVIVMIICAMIASSYRFTFSTIMEHLLSKLNWYLYAYLAFLIMLPLIRLFVKGMNARLGLLFCSLAFFLQTLVMFIVFSETEVALFSYTWLLVAGWGSVNWLMIFPVLGYLINEKIVFEDRRSLMILAGAAAFSLISCTLLMHFDIRIHEARNLEQLRQHAVFAIAALIMVCARVVEKAPVWTKRMLEQISGTVFGIFILDVTSKLPNMISDQISSTFWFAGLTVQESLTILMQFLIMGTIVYILRLIPPIRKLI